MSCQNIVLIGFMGSGKSSIGRLLAKKLGFQFFDTDRVLIERAGMEISEIFARHGEAYFRDLESSTLASLTHLNRCIIATGGGVVLREANRRLLSRLGFVVGLSATEEVIFERVSRNSKRPLLQTENPRQTLSRILTERHGLYEAAAQFTIDTSCLTHDQIAEAIIAEVRHAFQWQGAP
ncbi:MAG: shikimate kinase [Verrucomicrobiota bacterium]